PVHEQPDPVVIRILQLIPTDLETDCCNYVMVRPGRTISLDKKISVHNAEADRPAEPDDDEWWVSRVSAFRAVGMTGQLIRRPIIRIRQLPYRFGDKVLTAPGTWLSIAVSACDSAR